MTKIAVKSSVLGLIEETTEGTLKAPAAVTDYVKMQDDLSLTENKATIDNAEMTGSIGGAKPIAGISAPALSFSQYLRHSGTEGVAPDYGVLLKSLFGSEVVAGTEYDTVAGSTATVINVDSGEGVNYQRGQALLIKNSAGYEIRPIESVSTDALTMAFDTNNVAGTGIDLGKAVTYVPTNDSHPTLSANVYWGNGGLHQAVSGARVLGWDLSASSGELINGNFSIEGVNFYNNPLEVQTGVNDKLDFVDDNGTFVATIPAKIYSDTVELADAINLALNTIQVAETHTCVYNSTGADAGKFTIATSTSAILSLPFAGGASAATSIDTLIGFSADLTGNTTYSGTVIDFGAPHTPTYNNGDPLSAKSHQVLFGKLSSENDCLHPSTFSFAPSNEKANVSDICSESGVSSSLITGRSTAISFTAPIEKYDVAKFASYREGETVKFAYNFGVKSGGSWVAGKSGCLYAPTCTITEMEVVDEDGIARINVTVVPFVEDGAGEVFISFV